MKIRYCVLNLKPTYTHTQNGDPLQDETWSAVYKKMESFTWWYTNKEAAEKSLARIQKKFPEQHYGILEYKS